MFAGKVNASAQAAYSNSATNLAYSPGTDGVLGSDLVLTGSASFVNCTSSVTPFSGFTVAGLTDGVVSTSSYSNSTFWNGGWPVTLTFNLNTNPGTGGSATGYKISKIETIGGWTGSFVDQRYTVWVKTVGSSSYVQVGGNFVDPTVTGSTTSSRTVITDTTGLLASNVQSVQLVYSTPVNGTASALVLQEVAICGTVQATYSNSTTSLAYSPRTDGVLSNDLVLNGQPSSAGSTSSITPSGGFALSGLTDGSTSSSDNTKCTYFSTGWPVTLTFNLNTNTATGGCAAGYNISEIETIGGWTTGFVDQRYTVWVKAVGSSSYVQVGGNFLDPSVTSSTNSTRTVITDSSGTLATGIQSVQLVYSTPAQTGGQVVIQEVAICGTATSGPVLQAAYSNSTTAGAYISDISNTDLINNGQTSYASGSMSPSSPSGGTFLGLHDGLGSTSILSEDLFENGSGAWPMTLTFNLNTNSGTGGSATGYSISKIQSIAGWTSNFVDQRYTVWVKTVANPSTYVQVGGNFFDPTVASGTLSTKTAITESSGVLASGVTSVQLVYTAPVLGAANSLVIQEIDISGAASTTVSTLSGLALSAGTLSPTFASGTTSYTATVPYTTTSITAAATLTDSTATVTVNGASVTSGVASLPITLSVGTNTITTLVTAADGVTTSTYTTTVTRTAASTVSSLSGLALSSGTLSPTFASGTTSYTAGVSNATSSITVTPTVTDSTATVTVNGTSVTSGSASGSIALSVGSNTITTVVTAQDGTTTSTYTATVTRAASSVSTLSGLALSSGTLSPTFATGTTSYTASVSNATTSLTVTPTVTNSTATVTVNGTSVTSGSASGSISLSVGTNSINTTVTAQDGVTTTTYTVTVTRAPSTVSTLSGLALSAGTLSPSFATGTTSYTASVSNATSSLTVTPTVTNSTATVTVNGTSVTSGSASGSISLSVGSNTIYTVVTAQDGVTTSTYTVTVTRAPSTVSTLSDLALSSGTLSPTFATGTTSYTAGVSNSTSSITVTPTATDTTATITVNGTTVTSGSASGSISLSVGTNTITTTLTAQDTVTTTSYTVTITRAAPPTHSISGTVTLSGTGLSGVTVSDGTRTATTDGSGAYTITSVPDLATYTVTPSLTGYTFSPANQSVTLSGSDVTGKNFAMANAFGNWATTYGLSGADASPTANPSGDGISNLVKYALGLDPTVGAAAPGTLSGGTLTFTKGTMAKSDSNLVYSIEESTDLSTWSAPTGTSPSGTVVDGADTIVYTFPSAPTQIFARLKVVQTP